MVVQFGRNCEGSFEGYWIVVLGRRRNSLQKIRGFTQVCWNICQTLAHLMSSIIIYDSLRLFIYLFISCVNRMKQKVTAGFGWNFQGWLDLARLRGDWILVVIRISIWIRDRIEGFFTIARYGKDFDDAPWQTQLKKMFFFRIRQVSAPFLVEGWSLWVFAGLLFLRYY